MTILRGRTRGKPSLGFATSYDQMGNRLLTVTTPDTGQQAVLTYNDSLGRGCYTVTVQGPTRKFTEQKRVGVAYKDDFQRAPATGWGMSPYYGSCSRTAGGVLEDYTVTPGVGKIKPTVANTSYYMSYKDDLTDPDWESCFDLDTVPSGASNSWSMCSNYASTSEHIRARVTFQTNGNSIFSITTVVAGSETVLATVTGTITGYTAGTKLRVRYQQVGLAINAWLWLDGQSMPVSPTLTTTETGGHTSGRIVYRAFNTTGSSNAQTYRCYETIIWSGRWPDSLVPSVTHNWWVRLLPTPWNGQFSAETEEIVRDWFSSTKPDVLATYMSFVTAAPDVFDARLGAGRRVLGQCSYGTTLSDGNREEGADFNDYIRKTWDYPYLNPPDSDINELSQQDKMDCSGSFRMAYAYHGGIPPALNNPADFNGVYLPRRAVDILASGPGLMIASSTTQLTNLTDVRIGDACGFNGDLADDTGDTVQADDHIGPVVGVDAASGYRLFASARKTTNGVTIGPLGGLSAIEGSGFWATALRKARRI